MTRQLAGRIRRGAYTAALSLISILIMVPVKANAQGLEDPLKFTSIADFVQGALEAFVVISLPILAFFIIWSGFKFVLAQGKPGDLEKARENFKWLIVGAILILGAWSLALLISTTINSIRG